MLVNSQDEFEFLKLSLLVKLRSVKDYYIAEIGKARESIKELEHRYLTSYFQTLSLRYQKNLLYRLLSKRPVLEDIIDDYSKGRLAFEDNTDLHALQFSKNLRYSYINSLQDTVRSIEYYDFIYLIV